MIRILLFLNVMMTVQKNGFQAPNRKPPFFQAVSGRRGNDLAIPHFLYLLEIDPMLLKVEVAFIGIKLEFHS